MGQFLAALTVFCALAMGFGIYYAQVYAFYEEIGPEGAEIVLTPKDGAAPQPIDVSGFRAIDRDSSPIAYRACFDTGLSLAAARETYEPYEGSEPRNAPGWFGCFDAEAIGDRIEAGEASVFTGVRNLEFGIDRVVAITDDGRGYVWHEINECGDKAYDGTPLGEDCPPRDGTAGGN